MAALSADISRIDPLNKLYLGMIWDRLLGPFFMTMCLGVVLLLLRWVMTRSFDRVLAIVLGCLITASGGIAQIARTSLWGQFASMLVPSRAVPNLQRVWRRCMVCYDAGQ